MFKPLSISMPGANQTQGQAINYCVVNNVFKVLHGNYGNFFLAKFATGQIEEGKDKGVMSAREVWAHRLRIFDESKVETALNRCLERYKDGPPNLPQFLTICAAERPRQVYKPDMPAICMGQALRSKYAAKAREINAMHARKAIQNRLSTAEQGIGLDGLKQAIASAVAAAGGDEVAELMRLDNLLAPKGGPNGPL